MITFSDLLILLVTNFIAMFGIMGNEIQLLFDTINTCPIQLQVCYKEKVGDVSEFRVSIFVNTMLTKYPTIHKDLNK